MCEPAPSDSMRTCFSMGGRPTGKAARVRFVTTPVLLACPCIYVSLFVFCCLNFALLVFVNCPYICQRSVRLLPLALAPLWQTACGGGPAAAAMALCY